MTTLTAPTQTSQFLSQTDRDIISQIIDIPADQIITIRVEEGITVWVKTVDGYLCFDRNWFALRVAEVRAEMIVEAVKVSLSKCEMNILIEGICLALVAVDFSLVIHPNDVLSKKIQNILLNAIAVPKAA